MVFHHEKDSQHQIIYYLLSLYYIAMKWYWSTPVNSAFVLCTEPGVRANNIPHREVPAESVPSPPRLRSEVVKGCLDIHPYGYYDLLLYMTKTIIRVEARCKLQGSTQNITTSNLT